MDNESFEYLLVKDLLNKEYSALEKLMDIYSGKLYYYCNSILRNNADAEEAVQDTFIKVYKKIDSFNISTNFSSWIYRIASNTAKDLLRKRKTHAVCISFDKPLNEENRSDNIRLEIPDNSKNPEKAIQEKELKEVILNQVTELPELYREVLQLRHIEDFTYEEISEILYCKVGTVKSRLARAREILRKQIVFYK